MKKVKLKYNLENLISRIPTLFPCIVFNENNSVIKPSYELENGSYGKIVANIATDSRLYADDETEIPYITVYNKNYIYSYKTLMSYYYGYRNKSKRIISSDKNDLIKFIDSAISIIKIDRNDYEENQDLIPDMIYLSEVNQLLDKLEKAENSVCLCDDNNLYYRMGGDKFKNFLISKKDEFKLKSYYFYNKSVDISTYAFGNMHFNILLSRKIKDNGILTTDLNEWKPGFKYLDDKNENIKKGGEIITHGGLNWVCIDSDKSKGWMNTSTKKLQFDPMAFKKYPSTDYVRDEKFNNDNTYIGSLLKDKYNFFNENNEPIKKDTYIIDGETNTYLKSFRKYKSILNESDKHVEPVEGEDWLSLYRIGISDFNISTDDLGNIQYYGNYYTFDKNQYVTNLMAYGSGIVFINRLSIDRSLIFGYTINAHLKAKIHYPIKVDDLGNKIYYFDNFVFDLDSEINYGINYIDRYYYDKGSDIDNIRQDDFIKLINGEYEGLKRFEFKTNGNMQTRMLKNFDGISEYSYIKSFMNTKVDNKKDCLYNPVFKEDYLSGITFKPNINDDVKIFRGNNSAFERHIKLSEINSIDDMVNYQNGGFFKIKSIN